MKKLLFCLVITLILITGCSKQMNMNNILNEPNFAGIVIKVNEQSILVEVNEDEDEISSSDLMSVSLDVELDDSNIDFNIGDEVRIYYDGTIAESYPAQINKVYAIMLVDPSGNQSDKHTDKFVGDYNVEGQSEHWQASLEYLMSQNDRVWAEGAVKYMGSNTPEKVNMRFVIYDIETTSYDDGNVDALRITTTVEGRELIDSEIKISESFNKSHDLEVYEEAINNGYIEIEWEEDGQEIIERINIKIVE